MRYFLTFSILKATVCNVFALYGINTCEAKFLNCFEIFDLANGLL